MPNSLRAPAQHGEILLAPPGSLVEIARENEAALSSSVPLAQIRAEARQEVLLLATRWTHELIGSVRDAPHPQFWVMGGHQPELFHPGVWVKNAVVDGLAAQLGGVGLNLIVDNDICTSSSVSVPRSPETSGMTTLEWDLPKPQSPWEERADPAPEVFATFGQRCQRHLSPWGIDPLAASQDWGAASELGLVDRLVRLRAGFERSCGIQNLELKVSDLSETQSFRRFLFHSLQDAESLRDIYNTALADFRRTNRIRSRCHPVPALDSTPFGIEVPFWVWRAGEQRRCRLFVRQSEQGMLLLHDGLREIGTVPASSESAAITALADLRLQGWKIRPRALSLTLFCRVYLGSVFVHGIGGAKYDEMTDALMERWLGLVPPAIIVATATMRLFDRFAGSPAEPIISKRQAELRKIRWNPESMSAVSETSTPGTALRAEKSQLLSSKMPAAARHARLQAINSTLRAGLIEYVHDLRNELQRLLASVPYQHSLRSREYAANLFPAHTLQEVFKEAHQRVITQQ